jgi:filamentous hemagglutinin
MVIKPGDLTADEKRLVSSLVSIAGGLAGAAVTDGNLSMAAVGANTARVEVENNSLAAKDEKQRQDAKWSLPYIGCERKSQG